MLARQHSRCKVLEERRMNMQAMQLVLAALILSGAQAASAQGRSPLEAELIDLQQQQITANNAADIAALDRLTADDWTGVSATGVARNKTQFLEDVRRRGPAAVQRTPQQGAPRATEWRVYADGSTGVVTRLTAGDHGPRIWNTAVWSKRDGSWRRVFSQETAAQPPPAPIAVELK
jgi:hypothetical protein